MLYQYYLSIADITILLESDHPLIKSKEFEPFFIERTEADYCVKFQEVKKLCDIPWNLLYDGGFYQIGSDSEGRIRKYFFNNPKEKICYAVSFFDQEENRITVEYLKKYEQYVSEVKNSFFHVGFEFLLVKKNRLCLHASCVDTSMGGILFSGTSGIGKSTQAELWCKYRGARQINGDRPVLSQEDHEWNAWGSPYAGSSKCHLNEKCNITAIILLKQENSCKIKRLTPAEAFRGIWEGLTIHNWDPGFVDGASGMVIDLVTKVPVFEYGCTPDEQAVNYLEESLRKENIIYEHT